MKHNAFTIAASGHVIAGDSDGFHFHVHRCSLLSLETQQHCCCSLSRLGVGISLAVSVLTDSNSSVVYFTQLLYIYIYIKIKLMIGLTQCTIPWSSDKGSAKAASTPQPTASGTLLSEDYLQILEKLLLKGNSYSLFTWSFQALYFPSKYHMITVYEGFLPEENTQSSGPLFLCYLEDLMQVSGNMSWSPRDH